MIKKNNPNIYIAGLLLAAFFLSAPVSFPRSEPVERYFRIDAGQFAYSPAVLRVNPGDSVTIDLVATDVVHGLYIDEYALEVRADPGQTARLTFTADKTGLFRFRCPVPCGQLHPFMIGKIQVGPNLLFWRAILLALIVFLTFIPWKTPRPFASS